VLPPQSYAVDAILSGADLTNAVVDRVDFSNAKLNGAKFVNAVVTGRWGAPGWCWRGWRHAAFKLLRETHRHAPCSVAHAAVHVSLGMG
jgi:hypothetical protein